MILVFTALVSCNQGQTAHGEDDDTIAALQPCTQAVDVDFDSIPSLEGYFRALLVEDCVFPVWDSDAGDELYQQVYGCIAKIEDYRNGVSEYYPLDDVRKVLDNLVWNIGICESHGVYEDEDVRAFLYYFLAMAARYCPDISFLVDMRTEDYKAGIIYYSSYSTYPLESFLLTKAEKGFNVYQIGAGEEIRSIYHLCDEKDREYYLCSNNEWGIGFGHHLYLVLSGNEVCEVAQYAHLPYVCDEVYNVYFKRETLEWFACRENEETGTQVPIVDEPILTLTLDGNNSYFVGIDGE